MAMRLVVKQNHGCLTSATMVNSGKPMVVNQWLVLVKSGQKTHNAKIPSWRVTCPSRFRWSGFSHPVADWLCGGQNPYGWWGWFWLANPVGFSGYYLFVRGSLLLCFLTGCSGFFWMLPCCRNLFRKKKRFLLFIIPIHLSLFDNSDHAA